jgi:hypothetical protein
MYCPECGTEIKDQSIGCDKCGKKFEKPKRKDYGYLIVFLIIVGFSFFSIWAFLINPSSPIASKPQVHVDEISRGYAFGQSAIMFHIYNSGNGVANNVFAQIYVINGDSGTTIASKRIFVGNLNPGDSKQMGTTITHANYQNIKIRIVPQY